MTRSEQYSNISAALVKAQRKMGVATKDAKNPYFKSNYADLGSVMEVVKEPLNEQGITILQPAYSQALPNSTDLSHFVETILMHESGEYIASGPLKLELTKTDMQALGSAITYARRYTLQALLSIPAEDDDGEASMSRPKQQAKTPMTVVTTTSPTTLVTSTMNSTDTPTAKPRSTFRKSTPAAPTEEAASTNDGWGA